MISFLSKYGFTEETIQTFSRAFVSCENNNIVFGNLLDGKQVMNKQGFLLISKSTFYVLNVKREPIIRTIFYFSNFIEAMYFYQNNGIYNFQNSIFVIVKNISPEHIQLILKKYNLAKKHYLVFDKSTYSLIEQIMLTMYIKGITNISTYVQDNYIIFILAGKIFKFLPAKLTLSQLKKSIGKKLSYISWVNPDITLTLDHYNIIKREIS